EGDGGGEGGGFEGCEFFVFGELEGCAFAGLVWGKEPGLRVIRCGTCGAGGDVEDGVGTDDEVEGFFADGGVEALRGLRDEDGWLCGDGLAGDLRVGEGGA